MPLTRKGLLSTWAVPHGFPSASDWRHQHLVSEPQSLFKTIAIEAGDSSPCLMEGKMRMVAPALTGMRRTSSQGRSRCLAHALSAKVAPAPVPDVLLLLVLGQLSQCEQRFLFLSTEERTEARRGSSECRLLIQGSFCREQSPG